MFRSQRRLLSFAALAAVGMPTEAKPDQGGGAALPLVQVKLEPWRSRWAIEASIAGTSRKYLLDTGAGLTLISAATMKAAGCEPWGRATGFTMMGNKGQGPHCDDLPVFVGGREFRPLMITPIDMAKNNPKDAPLDGVVGLNLFDGQTVTFDFAGGTLTVESEESRAARIAKMWPLRIRLKREVDGAALAVVAAVPTAKGQLWMELDSGNGGTVLVSQPVAGLIGMDPKIEGKQRADFEVLDGIRATTDDAFTPDMIMDGNLGMPFLRNWVVTIDLGRGMAWLGKPSSPPKPAIPLVEAAGH